MIKNQPGVLMMAAVMLFAVFLTGCDGRKNFDDADTNDDGKVSKSEFKRYVLENVYANHDHNGDKQVTLKDCKRKNRNEDESKFSYADKNGDDVVTPEELKSLYFGYGTLDQLFRKNDANRDGDLYFEEITEFKASNQ